MAIICLLAVPVLALLALLMAHTIAPASRLMAIIQIAALTSTAAAYLLCVAYVVTHLESAMPGRQ